MCPPNHSHVISDKVTSTELTSKLGGDLNSKKI